MADHLKKHEYLKELDVTLELDYRLNFDLSRSCGFVRVYKGNLDKMELDEGEEAYEIYMELFECGLSEDDVIKNYDKIKGEVESGEIEI